MTVNLPFTLGDTPQQTDTSSGQLTPQALSTISGGGGGQILPTGAQAPPQSAPQTPTSRPVTNGGGNAAQDSQITQLQKMQQSGGLNPAQQSQLDALIAQLKADAANSQAAQEASIRSNISSAYQPIFDELDRQMGALPQQQTDLTNQVNTLAGQEGDQVKFNQGQDITSLNNSKQDEQLRGNQTLRDLGDSVQNLLKGAGFYLGSLGAGDSSAVEGATTAIGQYADKTRGQAMNVTNQALNQLDRQVAQVNAVASNNLKQIDDMKTNKLFEIAQWATDQLNQLNSQKAQAKGQEGMAIAQLIQNTQSQFLSRVQQLDDQVNQYKMAVSAWAQQNAGYLNDQLTLMNAGAQYSSQTAPQYKYITDQANGVTYAANPYNPTQVTPVVGPGVTSQVPQSTSLLDKLGSLFSNTQQSTFQPSTQPLTDFSAQ